MKTFADEHWERQVEHFKPFRSLWKTDDEEWIAARKKAWETACGEPGGDPWELGYSKFYIYGEEPPKCVTDGSGRETDFRFDIHRRISYTPFENAGQLHEFWEALVRRNPSGSRHDHGLFRSPGWLDNFPERDQMVKLFAETMFAPEYFMLAQEGKEAKRVSLATINPRDFARSYADKIRRYYRKNNRHQWEYQNFTIDYFLLAVRDAAAANEIDNQYDPEFIQMYDLLLQLDDAELSHYRLELKKNLISVAEADDAPDLLRDALIAARDNQD